MLERLVAELRGLPSDAVESVAPRLKGMAITRSFGTPVCDFDRMMGVLSQYALRAGEKLRIKSYSRPHQPRSGLSQTALDGDKCHAPRHTQYPIDMLEAP